MVKRLGIIFILSILLFLAVGAASASDDNSTDNVQADSEDSPVSLDNSSVDVSNGDEDILEDSITLKSQNTPLLKNNKAASSKSKAVSSSKKKQSKSKLTLTANSNFVKKGNPYYMFLTDSQGKGVKNKKLTVKFNGKTYKKTTNKYGRIGINVNLAKSSTSISVSYKGDSKYKAFSKTLKVKIDKSLSITIGNSKLLKNGYLRIYLKGPLKDISHKKIQITVGKKKFTKRTSHDGYVIVKPNLSPKSYKVTVKYNKYRVSKKLKCIEGNVLNPLKDSIPTKNGVPDIDVMPGNYVMGDNNAKYTLKKSQYLEVLKRDSYCLFLKGKLTKYTFFKTKASPKIYHIIKREKWNVIERAINTKVVKMNKYRYWPNSISVSLKGKSYTYPVVRDFQNTNYTCGPAAASVCSQALKNFHSEKYFQIEAHVVKGIDIPYLKKVLEENEFSAEYFHTNSLNDAVKQLRKGAVLIAYLPCHYVAVIDVSPDGKKILVSNSYGSYDVGSKKVPTNWVSLKYFKTRFAGVGLVVKCNYKLSDKVKSQINSYYRSMGPGWKAQNVGERIPDIGV